MLLLHTERLPLFSTRCRPPAIQPRCKSQKPRDFADLGPTQPAITMPWAAGANIPLPPPVQTLSLCGRALSHPYSPGCCCADRLMTKCRGWDGCVAGGAGPAIGLRPRAPTGPAGEPSSFEVRSAIKLTHRDVVGVDAAGQPLTTPRHDVWWALAVRPPTAHAPLSSRPCPGRGGRCSVQAAMQSLAPDTELAGTTSPTTPSPHMPQPPPRCIPST